MRITVHRFKIDEIPTALLKSVRNAAIRKKPKGARVKKRSSDVKWLPPTVLKAFHSIHKKQSQERRQQAKKSKQKRSKTISKKSKKK